MATHFHVLLGTDELGRTANSLLNSSLAQATYANYDSKIRHFFAFCNEEKIQELQSEPATMVRYNAWLVLQGTIAAASLQAYLSAVNKFSATINNHPRRLATYSPTLAAVSNSDRNASLPRT
jgi:site-specific recombinase XerC